VDFFFDDLEMFVGELRFIAILSSPGRTIGGLQLINNIALMIDFEQTLTGIGVEIKY